MNTALILLAILAVVVSLQWASGAFTAEFSGYPDEAAHYVSGLLVHDYVAAGFPGNAVEFAQKFYLHYPYVALGHWPPLFYALEGGWMLAMFSTSRISAILLMGLITAFLAQSTFLALRAEFGRLAALMAALLVVCIPVVQQYASLVMMDTLLALLSFWAVLRFARYCESGKWRDSILFGVLTCLAILTKGNGFDLALVPPIAVILSRRFHLFKRLSFWVPALMVLVVSVPWHLFTMHLMLPTFTYTFGVAFTWHALRFYALVLLNSLGPLALALAAVGLFTSILSPATKTVDPKWAAVAAFLFGILIFYCTVPAGIEARYLIAAMPPLVMCFVAGAHAVAGFLTRFFPWRRQILARALIACSIVLFAATCFSITRKVSYGFREAARALVGRPDINHSLSIVSSALKFGEGLMISETAMKGRQNGAAMFRASKILADEDWNGRQYRPRYANTATLMKCLDASGVRYLILDHRPGKSMAEHHRQLWEIVNSRPDRWNLAGAFGGQDGGTVYVYASSETKQLTGDATAGLITNMSGTVKNWPIVMSLTCGEEEPTPFASQPALK